MSIRCQILERACGDSLNSDAKESLNYLAGSANRMQCLIRGLLEYAQIGHKEADFGLVDCNAVLKEVLADLEQSIRETKASVVFSSLPKVYANRIQLRRLFQNLIDNALKFHGRKPPQIEIKTRNENGDWIFEVVDNGIGIEPRYFKKIFAIFQRLHTSEEYPGTGIGLSICQRIVDHHGGQIWVESNHGSGSTFGFSLPTKRDKYRRTA